VRDQRWEAVGLNERHAERIAEQDAHMLIGTNCR
jgi:hypothetical protein